MDPKVVALVAEVVDLCAGAEERRRGRAQAHTGRVLAALSRLLREGAPWRRLRAGPEEASGSTLRRRLKAWSRTDLLSRAHAALVRMLRGGPPDLIIDSCSVRAKRGGELTGPNPTDRAKRGTKYHLAVTGDGVPVACAATAANVNDTVPFGRLLLAGFAVLSRIRTVFADRGYDAERHRILCRAFGAEPCIHSRGRPRGSGLGRRRWPVERTLAWVLENRRLALRYDRLGFVVRSLLQSACIFLVARRVARDF